MNPSSIQSNMPLKVYYTAGERSFAEASFWWWRWWNAPLEPAALTNSLAHTAVGLSSSLSYTYQSARRALCDLSCPPETSRQAVPKECVRKSVAASIRPLEGDVSLPTASQISSLTLTCLPASCLEKIVLQLRFQDRAIFAQVSTQTALAVQVSENWEGWAAKLAYHFESAKVFSAIQPALKFFALNKQGEIWLKKQMNDDSIRHPLAAFPTACWIMQLGTRERAFHFSFRSPTGEITLYRDVALDCRASLRYEKVFRIINNPQYLQIKG